MSNYNTQLQSNNSDLQTVLQTLQTKATGGEQATPVISVNSYGLITATAGTKSSTHQLAFQPAKTITPSTASQIAVSGGYYTGGNVVVKGDSNLVAENIKNGVSIFGVSGTLESGGSSGEQVEWSANEDAIIGRTIRSYTNDRITTIGSYAFGNCSILTTINVSACRVIGDSAFFSCINLSTASFPACTNIGVYAFALCTKLSTVSFPACTNMDSYVFKGCTKLSTVSFPACTTIGSFAFYDCTNLTTVSFPACISINTYAFNNCTKLSTVSFPACKFIYYSAFNRCSNLTTVSFPACESIYYSAFYGCINLSSANFPACTNIGNSVFYSCSSLTSVSFPACTNIGSYAFYSCSSLTSVSFPACTNIGSYAFQRCTDLTSVSFPACTNIGSYAFQSCYNLSRFYLTGSSVCKLSNSNAFSSTPYAGYSSYFSGTPYIYVPGSLLTSYKNATNWTYFSSYFSAMDGGDSGDSDIFTFTISNLRVTEYQAESGMTWGEWCNSDYNTDGYVVVDDRISDSTYGFMSIYTSDSNIGVKSTDVITSQEYTLM